MPDVSRSASVTYSLGPGYPTPAVKQLLIVTIAAYLLQFAGEFIPVGYDALGRVMSLNYWLVTWLGLTLSYFYDQPVGFYITSLAFGAYLLAHAGRWVTQRVRNVRPATS